MAAIVPQAQRTRCTGHVCHVLFRRTVYGHSGNRTFDVRARFYERNALQLQ
jgi:hypothetical protein